MSSRLDRVARRGFLPQRIEERREPRLLAVAAEDHGAWPTAPEASRTLARATRRLADIERRAAAADPAAQHHEPDLRAAQRLAADPVAPLPPEGGEGRRLGEREGRHRAAARLHEGVGTDAAVSLMLFRTSLLHVAHLQNVPQGPGKRTPSRTAGGSSGDVGRPTRRCRTARAFMTVQIGRPAKPLSRDAVR